MYKTIHLNSKDVESKVHFCLLKPSLSKGSDGKALASSTPEIPGSNPLHQNDKAGSVAPWHRTDTTG